MKKQTAVEWLYEQFKEGRHHTDKEYEKIFIQAKEMENKQRRESYDNGYINGEMDAYTE